MAVTGLSEFSFGFAFLFEQAQRKWTGLRAAPILPSLRQEADEGWDAYLPARGVDFYYQFKLSDYLARRNARFIRDGTYQSPYYRIALHARDLNRQHQRLRTHAVANPNTFYVAPEFRFLEEFNLSYLARQITENSRLIRVADCDDINDGEQHYLTFCAGDPGWRQHSEPRRREHSTSGKEIEALYRRTEPDWRPLDRAFASRLLDKTRHQVEDAIESEWRVSSAAPALRLLDEDSAADATLVTLLRRCADLLAVFYGVTLVMVGAPD